jgi:hypothetical protein
MPCFAPLAVKSVSVIYSYPTVPAFIFFFPFFSFLFLFFLSLLMGIFLMGSNYHILFLFQPLTSPILD